MRHVCAFPQAVTSSGRCNSFYFTCFSNKLSLRNGFNVLLNRIILGVLCSEKSCRPKGKKFNKLLKHKNAYKLHALPIYTLIHTYVHTCIHIRHNNLTHTQLRTHISYENRDDGGSVRLWNSNLPELPPTSVSPKRFYWLRYDVSNAVPREHRSWAPSSLATESFTGALNTCGHSFWNLSPFYSVVFWGGY